MPMATEIIGIVGLGYVGLPLACAFARHMRVIGYDLNAQRIASLRKGRDATGEVPSADLRQSTLKFTARAADLRRCAVFIVAVPTPVDNAKIPDLRPIRSAAATVGQILTRGALVVFESTVYPGLTEEICLPILENESGLKLGEFGLGYSPERINPGDCEHTLDKVVKIVSGHDAATTARVARLYSLVACAGVHCTPNIKTAEAAKVIENIQRDLNIALMNELAKIFARLNIRTRDVLAAAGTKWNFHKHHPGLVGGHCIGVDPYYLTHRALEVGIHPQVILAGRSANDSMGRHVGEMTLRALIRAGKTPTRSSVALLGLTFKENVRDTRNSRVVDVIRYLRDFGVKVIGCDPNLGPKVKLEDETVENRSLSRLGRVEAIVLVNRHIQFDSLRLSDLRRLMRPPVLVDLKAHFDPAEARRLGFHYVEL
ncbi:MAG: nucleotide sugar dehydrogenase [Verrucomicrobia bacterium]|nr:nucleotide sugar dehydrogenase [Verrucomicrobiota bacterium]